MADPQPDQPVGTRWIAHRGLATQLAHGSPTAETLTAALQRDIAMLELDVQVTRDGALILRHSVAYQKRIPTYAVSLEMIRSQVPHTMLLDEGVRLVGSRIPLLLDIKTNAAAAALGKWLRDRPDAHTFTVCSDSITQLQIVRRWSPQTAIWFTLPDVPHGLRPPWLAIAKAVLRERDPRQLARTTRELARALADANRIPRWKTGPFSGIVWRPYLREGLMQIVKSTGATGLCVHQWLVTPALVEVAHELGLTVDAWTVNRERDARRMVECRVDLVTSDDPVTLRHAIAQRRWRDLMGRVTQIHKPNTLRVL